MLMTLRNETFNEIRGKVYLEKLEIGSMSRFPPSQLTRYPNISGYFQRE